MFFVLWMHTGHGVNPMKLYDAFYLKGNSWMFVCLRGGKSLTVFINLSIKQQSISGRKLIFYLQTNICIQIWNLINSLDCPWLINRLCFRVLYQQEDAHWFTCLLWWCLFPLCNYTCQSYYCDLIGCDNSGQGQCFEHLDWLWPQVNYIHYLIYIQTHL